MSPWISAARLKTLPLAISGIILGSAVAYLNNSFQLPVLLLGLSTAVLLQILSNYANDYGDFQKGTDKDAMRNDRMLAAGKISKKQMQVALIILLLLAFASGLSLIQFSNIPAPSFYLFLALGVIAMASAVAYTVGKNAYGYRGLGDLFVLLFFGFASVSGVNYLHTNQWLAEALFASIGCGLLSVGVLNVNNMRDIETDASSGKKTIPVRIGKKKAIWYHKLLIWFGFTGIPVSFIIHIMEHVTTPSVQEIAMLAVVFLPFMLLLSGHVYRIKKVLLETASESNEEVLENKHLFNRTVFNKELKFLSLVTLGISLVYFLLSFLYT